jgi:kinetochor protein Mis14/NSL1
VPQATASKWSDATQAGIDADEELLRVVCERVAEEGSVSGRKALEGMGELERQGVVEGRWNEAVEGLGRLKRDMPAAVAKMERARVAAGYVSGSGGR